MTDHHDVEAGDEGVRVPVMPAQVIQIVIEEARRFGVEPRDLWRPGYHTDTARRPIQHARFAIWRRLRNERGWSYPRIARLFGVYHNAVMYGVKQAEKRACV